MIINDLLKFTFKHYPLNHSLNKKQIKKFIEASDPEVRTICKKIFDNTQHISFEFFLTRLNICINELLKIINLNRPIFVFIDSDTYAKGFKYKSNFWLFTYLKQYIKSKLNKTKEFIIINNLENYFLTNNDTVILIDDCMYSGLQMSNSIRHLINKKKLKLSLYLLVPFISDKSIQKVNDAFNKKHNLYTLCKIIYPINYIKPRSIDNVLNKDELKFLNNYYKRIDEIYDSYLIYFDHKLADTISTITPFYLGIVPNQKNLIVLKTMNQKHNYSYLLQIIPVINKCNKYVNHIDIYSPKCPYPPYKKGFMDFINKHKKDVIKYKSLSFPSNSNSISNNIKNKSY